MEVTREFIREYCAKNKISSSALESKAGLTRDSIYSFLIGKVSDLKFSSASKIADTIGCSLDELAGKKTYLPLYSTDTAFNKDLFKASVDFVVNYLDQHHLVDIKLGVALSAIDTIYDYSFKNHKKSVDADFSNWSCNNFFSKSN